MIAVVDYGVGNLFSLSSSLTYLNIPNEITSQPEVIKNADGIILPGVGAFGDAMDKLTRSALREPLDRAVQNGKPLLGICLGMQLLFEKSCEFGEHGGLGYLKGEVVSMKEAFGLKNISLKVPQIGWNALQLKKECPILKYTSEGEYMYYVHSFYVPEENENTAAYSEYGIDVAGTVFEKNVYGCQFHPEKSGEKGLKILKAFAEICEA